MIGQSNLHETSDINRKKYLKLFGKRKCLPDTNFLMLYGFKKKRIIRLQIIQNNWL